MKGQPGKRWLTKSGVPVVEVARMKVLNAKRGIWEWKVLTKREWSGGAHGWLWERNLKRNIGTPRMKGTK